MKILGALGPIERFSTPDQLVDYAGLGARVHDSGQRKLHGAITKFGRVDLRSATVTAGRHARIVNKHWKDVYRSLEGRIGRNKAVVAVARRTLISVWHILSKRQPDRFADWSKVATDFMPVAYDDFGGAEHIPGGRTAPEFTRWCLDQLRVCEWMQRAKFSGRWYILPQSTLPGASAGGRTRARPRIRVWLTPSSSESN